MKYWLGVLGLGLLLCFMACGPVQRKVEMDTPEGTFKELVASIQVKDLDRYAKCWYPAKADQEGWVNRLRNEPGLWTDLQRLFTSESKLVDRQESQENGLTIATFEVETPGIENGDRINALSMVQDGKEWKMYHW